MPEQQASKDKVHKWLQHDNCLAIRRSGQNNKTRHYGNTDRVPVIIKGPQAIVEQELQEGDNEDVDVLGAIEAEDEWRIFEVWGGSWR
jgi:hypothetical protein